MQIDPEVWERLALLKPIGDNLVARLALPHTGNRLQCAIDSDNRRHLIIPLKPSEEEFHDSQSRGLSVVTRELITQGQDSSSRYLDIECQDIVGNAALDLIGGELASALSAEDKPPREIVKSILARWRRFWSELPKNILSPEELIGLFGELWFLSFWLIPNAGLARSVQRWRGPFGARHDFEWPGKSIEVKASTSTRGRIHRINGIEQLMSPESGELLVFSLQVREEAGAANTLPTLISITRSLLEPDLEALNDFDMILVRTGYSPIHDEQYARVRLRIADEGLFAVTNNFPRIIPNLFEEGVPPGVETITYEINLNSFDHLKIASTPEQATVFFQTPE
jgi:hypothetical protein